MAWVASGFAASAALSLSTRPLVSSLNSRSARPVLLPRPASLVPPNSSKTTTKMMISSGQPKPKIPANGVMMFLFSDVPDHLAPPSYDAARQYRGCQCQPLDPRCRRGVGPVVDPRLAPLPATGHRPRAG